jgi:hypothetical protein
VRLTLKEEQRMGIFVKRELKGTFGLIREAVM